MKRLFKSSNFWNAVFGSIIATIAFKTTDSEMIAAGIFALFTIRSIASGGSDFVKANKNVTFNQETGLDEKVK